MASTILLEGSAWRRGVQEPTSGCSREQGGQVQSQAGGAMGGEVCQSLGSESLTPPPTVPCSGRRAFVWVEESR